MRPKNPVVKKKVHEVVVSQELSNKEVLLQQLRDLGVSSYNVESKEQPGKT